MLTSKQRLECRIIPSRQETDYTPHITYVLFNFCRIKKSVDKRLPPKMNGVRRRQPITMEGLPLLDRVKRDCVNRSISVIVAVAGRFIPSVV